MNILHFKRSIANLFGCIYASSSVAYETISKNISCFYYDFWF